MSGRVWCVTLPPHHLVVARRVRSYLPSGAVRSASRPIVVGQCFDHKKDMLVALKMIRNKKRFHHQALVEVKILEHLMAVDKEHRSNIVRVHGYFYFRNHLCIAFEPLSINLYEFIKNNHFQGLSLGLIRRFAIQLLTSLAFLAQQRIIHCDLKVTNDAQHSKTQQQHTSHTPHSVSCPSL